MSMGHVGKTTNIGRDAVAVQAREEREDQWGPMPMEVVSFDPATQTATAKPQYRPKHNGEPVEMPELYEVPVRFPRLGQMAMTWPVNPGDVLMGMPMMRGTEKWHTEGKYESTDTRSSSLADYELLAFSGQSLTKPIPNFNNNAMEIRSEDGQFKMEMQPDGKFRQTGAEGNAFKIIGDALKLIGEDQLQIAYGSSQGSGHALQNAAGIIALANKLLGMSIE